MKSWKASMLVCDDVLVSLSGKFNLLGMYTSDLGVPADPTMANQLVFFFIVEGDLEDRPGSIVLEVTFPGGDTRQTELSAPLSPGPPPPDRKKWYVRAPFLVQNVALRPGRIEGKLKHDGAELAVQGPWISLTPRPSPTPTAS
jgi:hypothetical protein